MFRETIFDYTPILDIIYNIKQLPQYKNASLHSLMRKLESFINESNLLPDHIREKHSDYKSSREFYHRMMTVTSLWESEKPLANVGFITSELEQYLSDHPNDEELTFPRSVFKKSISQPFHSSPEPKKEKTVIDEKDKTRSEQLELENKKLREEIESLKKHTPILLGSFRQDDPLMLAIEMRNKHWSDYNPDDKRTRPTQEAILEDLDQMGIDKTEAERIERVSSPIKRKK